MNDEGDTYILALKQEQPYRYRSMPICKIGLQSMIYNEMPWFLCLQMWVVKKGKPCDVVCVVL